MLYLVECNYADPDSEAEWNGFYSDEKLPALISVHGFLTSQRFRRIGPDGPAYLAIHTLAGEEVLRGEAYRRQGGGNFARWQAHIRDWRRSLYDGVERAPDVGPDDCLALSLRGPDSLRALGLAPRMLHGAGLAAMPAQRWFAVSGRHELARAGTALHDVLLYRPITPQLTACAARPLSPLHARH